jgi:hypothetical protein
MEPFQIFSLRQRPEISRQNPSLTNSELTSLLGRMWRSLPQNEKQEYLQLALNVATERRQPRKRRSKPKPEDIVEQISTSPNPSPPSRTIDHIQFDDCPCFSIVPRSSSGTLVASASHHIVFPGRTASNSLLMGKETWIWK